MNQKRKATLLSAATIGVLAVLVLSLGNIGTANTAQADQLELEMEKGIKLTGSPEEHLAEGVNSVILVSSDQENLRIEQGSSKTASFTVTHIGGQNPVPEITMGADGIRGKVLPASVLATSTVEERVNQLRESGTISGAVDLSPLASFSPNEVTLKSGESATIQMQVVIPSGWNDELAGQKVNFAPSIYRVGDYSQYKIAVFADDIGVTIGE